MKHSLSLLLCVLCAALFAACTKDMDEQPSLTPEQEAAYAKIVATPDGAAAGVLMVQVTPEVADRIEEGVTRSGGTRSGIESMDECLDRIGTERFHRVFPADPEFDSRERAFGLHLWYYVRFDKSMDLMEAARTLSMDVDVNSVCYDYYIRMIGDSEGSPVTFDFAGATRAGAQPFNDPLLPKQWHYNNDGTVAQPSVAGADINLYEAWKLCTGESDGRDIVVAVIDEPVQYTHPDLAANMWKNPRTNETGLEHGANFVYEDESDKSGAGALPLDWNRGMIWQDGRPTGKYEYLDHGTHVAGTIAAVNNNGLGGAGIAGGSTSAGGNVKIMSCQWKAPGTSSSNGQTTLASARAFQWAANHGAVIAQNSWGFGATSPESFSAHPVRSAIDYFIENAGAGSPLKGGLVIFAAGNDGPKNNGTVNVYPSAYNKVIAVAAMAPDCTPAVYTDFGTWVDITAPGGDYYYKDGEIISTVLDPETANVANLANDRSTGYAAFSGTSMACPHVSGVAALGLAYAAKLGKTFTVDEYRTLLLSSTNPIEPYLTGNKYEVGGDLTKYRRKMGAGYIDALKLLANIAGAPIVTIPATGETVRVNVGAVLGAAGTINCTVTLPADVKSRLGISGNASTAPQGNWTLRCKNAGSGMITVSAEIGGTTVSREVLLVAKSAVAENGGWL